MESTDPTCRALNFDQSTASTCTVAQQRHMRASLCGRHRGKARKARRIAADPSSRGQPPVHRHPGMVAIRMLVDHLVMGGVLEHNPARFANAPPQKRNKGKTAVPTAEETGYL